METVKEYWLAGKTDETLKEIRQILQQRDGPNIPNTDTLLLFSNIYYKLGSLQQAIKLLNEGMTSLYFGVCFLDCCNDSLLPMGVTTPLI